MDIKQQLQALRAAREEEQRLLEEAIRQVEQTDYLGENQALRQEVEQLRQKAEGLQSRLRAANEQLRQSQRGSQQPADLLNAAWSETEERLAADARELEGRLDAYRQAVERRVAEVRGALQQVSSPQAVDLHRRLAEAEGLLQSYLAGARGLQQELSNQARQQLRGELDVIAAQSQSLPQAAPGSAPAQQPPPPQPVPQAPSAAALAHPGVPQSQPQIPQNHPQAAQQAPQGHPIPQGQSIPQALGQKAAGAAASRPAQSQEGLQFKLGIRLAGIVGAAFILLGVVLGLSYGDNNLLQSDLVKCLGAYGIGVVLVGLSEILCRRNKNMVSTCLCAGGVAVLFATTAIGHFLLEVLPALGAVGLCMLVAVLALLLSLRHNSQIIAIFAVVGGHMPMIALGSSMVVVYSGMLYFLLLNLFVLLVAVRKKWQVLKYFSLLLSAWSALWLMWEGATDFPGAMTLYITANFLLYLAIVLIHPVINKQVLQAADTVLLAMNTVFSCGFIYWVLNADGGRLEQFNGLMALGFCVLYFVMARVLGKLLEEDAGTRGVFYATSLTFLVLGIPLQLDARLITIGWVIEGAALCVYGIASKRKWYRVSGMGVYALSFASFLLVDTLAELPILEMGLYLWQFGAVAAGGTAILAAIVITYRDPAFWAGSGTAGVRFFKGCLLLFNWVFLLVLTGHLVNVFYHQPVTARFSVEAELAQRVAHWRANGWLTSAARLAVTWAYGVLTARLPAIRSRVTRNLGVGLCSLGYLWLWTVNGSNLHTMGGSAPAHTWGMHLVILLVLNLAGIAAAWVLTRTFTAGRPKGREWHPLLTSAASLILVVQMLMFHQTIGFNHMLVSFVLLAAALGLIVFSYFKHFLYTYWFGYILSMASILKLLLVDLAHLEIGHRVVSCFVFGPVFFLIAFVGQLYQKRMFLRQEPPPPPGE